MIEKTPKENDLRVWWIPQIPGKAFHVSVDDINEAKKIISILEEYDDFQLKENIKPDYSNAGGLEIFQCGQWSEWESKDGECIDDLEVTSCKPN